MLFTSHLFYSRMFFFFSFFFLTFGNFHFRFSDKMLIEAFNDNINVCSYVIDEYEGETFARYC